MSTSEARATLTRPTDLEWHRRACDLNPAGSIRFEENAALLLPAKVQKPSENVAPEFSSASTTEIYLPEDATIGEPDADPVVVGDPVGDPVAAKDA